MKNRFQIVPIGILISCYLFLSSCNQEITLVLPVYTPKMVLEFYLEEGKPLSCLLQESINYTDTALFNLIDDAVIVVSYNGQSDTLKNQIYFDRKFGKVYNYYNPKIFRSAENVTYSVTVKDPSGRVMTGSTMLNEKVPIDSIVYKFNSKNIAATGLVFTDKGSSKDYYRIVAFKDSVLIEEENVWDIRFSDVFFNGEQFNFFTGNDFYIGDTVVGRLYHLTEAHHNFVQSVSSAESSNGNPFGQPANIISNVTGGIGVFTIVNYSEEKLVIK